MRFPSLLATLLVTATPLAAQSELEVHFLDVDQGDATLVIGPTGKTLLIDGGNNGDGYNVLRPYLLGEGVNSLDYVVASHYHADHLGGLDELWNSGIRATYCYDRGNTNQPSTQSYTDYKSAYSSVRRTIVPGQSLDLGGGATATCYVVGGSVYNGGTVNISGSSQLENSSSIGMLIEYGDFDLWIGGDLTGGGNGTTDVESVVAQQVGDIDVYQCNHHASRTSTNSAWVSWLDPEFVVIPCGSQNSYGYPKQEVVDRLNHPTHVIPLWSVSEGTGGDGFVDVDGDIVLTTDGNTYEVFAPDGTTMVLHTDEQSPAQAEIGEVAIAEFHDDPSRVTDAYGEYLEFAGTRSDSGVSLQDLSVSDATSDYFRFAASILLAPTAEIVVAADGLPSRNGGFTPHLVWPSGTFTLNSSDSIRLKRSSTVIDQVDYTTSWPSAGGVAAERIDLNGPSDSGNFAAASTAFGLGDRGTPGTTNAADQTNWGLSVAVTTQPTVGGQLDMDWAAPGYYGWLYQGAASYGSSPGFDVGGVHVPLNMDSLYDMTSVMYGWSGMIPASELVSVTGSVPNSPGLHGLQFYVAFGTYRVVGGLGMQMGEVSPAVAITIP